MHRQVVLKTSYIKTSIAPSQQDLPHCRHGGMSGRGSLPPTELIFRCAVPVIDLLSVQQYAPRRPERSRGDNRPVEGYRYLGHPRRAEKDGRSVRHGRRPLGHGIGGGPGHSRGDLRLLRECPLCVFLSRVSFVDVGGGQTG